MTPQENEYNDLLTEIGQLTIITMLLPVAVALVRYRYLNKPTRVFLGYLLATIAVNLIEQAFIWSVNTHTSFWLPYLTRWQIGDTHFLQILAYLKNFLLLGWYFGRIVPTRIGRWIVGVALALSLLAVVDYLWLTGYHMPGVLMPTLNGVFTTTLPMIHLWFLVRRDQKVSLSRIPYFWFSTGLILSYLFQLLFFFLGQKIYQTDFLLYVKLSIAGNFLRVLSQVVFAYGFSQGKLLRFL